MTSLHNTSHDIASHHTTPHLITPHHITSHLITPHHITPLHTTSYHITPHHTATSLGVTSLYLVSTLRTITHSTYQRWCCYFRWCWYFLTWLPGNGEATRTKGGVAEGKRGSQSRQGEGRGNRGNTVNKDITNRGNTGKGQRRVTRGRASRLVFVFVFVLFWSLI